MFLSQLTIRNFRLFGEGASELRIDFQSGVNALVGRNDSGKSAIIDAVRYVLRTRDQEFIRVQPEDFHINGNGKQATEIFLRCTLDELSDAEKGSLIEYLSYEGNDAVLHINWTARKLNETPGTRRWLEVSVRSGVDGTGPAFETSVRELLSAAYLRPLRDAEREMSPGRGSRLSQILANVPAISEGEDFNAEKIPQDVSAVRKLSLVGLADYMRHSISMHSGIENAQKAVNERYLDSLSLHGDKLQGKIDVSEGGSPEARLRQILERLELGLLSAEGDDVIGRYGLGSNNLLFMACELLLLGNEPEGFPLLLIEEPEAHLHPQRQLRLMDFLNLAAMGEIKDTHRAVQVLLSTHSPNLASKISLDNLILLDGRRAFPLDEAHTKLEAADYRFLQRFLDVTKSNLFFAHGVLIVEGDAEAILLPVLAKLIGNDLTEHGVSIVNVGGKGLRRFSRIFQRSDDNVPAIGVPVACIADLDVMPDCAPEILGLVEGDNDERWQSSTRRWRAVRDLGDDAQIRQVELAALRERLKRDDGQSVCTFVADHWTLEYDLAISGLAEEVFVAASLAKNDHLLNAKKTKQDEIVVDAKTRFASLKSQASGDMENLCTRIYSLLHSGRASKAIAAQYLADNLSGSINKGNLTEVELEARLPPYLRNAFAHVAVQSQQHLPHGGMNGDADG